MIVCLDTGLLLRGVEGSPDVRAAVIDLIQEVEDSPGGVVIASAMAYAECMVKPVRFGDHGRVQEFDAFFEHSGVVLVDISRDILAEAVRIRAHRHLKMPDALQVATAIVSGCSLIVSTDSDIVKAGPYGALNVRAFPS